MELVFTNQSNKIIFTILRLFSSLYWFIFNSYNTCSYCHTHCFWILSTLKWVFHQWSLPQTWISALIAKAYIIHIMRTNHNNEAKNHFSTAPRDGFVDNKVCFSLKICRWKFENLNDHRNILFEATWLSMIESKSTHYCNCSAVCSLSLLNWMRER